MSAGLRVETGHATSVGRVRTKQEDRYLDSGRMIAVADGMGGLARGDFAARTMIDALAERRMPDRTAQVRTELKRAINRAGHKIARSSHRGAECGTTVVGAVLGQATASPSWLIFHVGDSRMYSYENGDLECLTRDHSLVQELIDAGIISREQARYDPRRSIVTRAIGTSVSAEPSFRHVEATPRILIACSDGISDELTHEEISDIMRRYEGETLTDTARALVDAALESGGRDNATVVLARAVQRK